MAILFQRTIQVGLLVKVIFLFVVTVYAATVATSGPSYNGQQASAVTITSNFLVTDKGFAKTGSAILGTATCPSAGNVTFSSSAQTSSAGVASGHVFFDAQVNTTATTLTVSCFTVALTLVLGSGSPTSYTVKVATGPSVSAGWSIDCKFDVGTSLPVSPFSFKVAVQ